EGGRARELGGAVPHGVPGMPSEIRLGHRKVPGHVPYPCAGPEAEVTEHLTPAGVREASAFPLQVLVEALPRDGLLQGSPDPAGHPTPPGTPAESGRGLPPA